MATWDPNDPIFDALGSRDDYVSPFPASFSSEYIESLGGYSTGGLAKAGALAFAKATQFSLQVKALKQGDILSDWIPSLIQPDASTGGLKGIFARVEFDTSENLASFTNNMAATGFSLAEGVLTSIPVYGQCIGAAIGAARFLASLRGKSPDQVEVIVPWKEYDRDIDEQIVKTTIFPLMEFADWSQIYWPSLAWEDGEFTREKGSEGPGSWVWGIFDANGNAKRNTSAPGALITGSSGLGFMPGSQTVADVVQFKKGGVRLVESGQGQRIDAITPVGSFFPASSQTATALWELVRKEGNPDMFKIRAGEVGDAWRGYFGAMRAAFASTWNYLWREQDTFDGPIELGKIVSPFLVSGAPLGPVDLSSIHSMIVWPGMARGSGAWQPDPDDGRPACVPPADRDVPPHFVDPHDPDAFYVWPKWWPKGWLSDIHYQAGGLWPPTRCQGVPYTQTMRAAAWRWMDQACTSPACDQLKRAQHRALYAIPICAYVRPVDLGPDLPAHGAFKDRSAPFDTAYSTFGDELVARCQHAREVLLTRELRFKIRLEDVMAIDLPYAQRLRESGVDEESWKRPLGKAAGPVGLGDEPPPPPPPNNGPTGGVPFAAQQIKTSGGGGGLLAVGAAVGLGLALKGRAR